MITADEVRLMLLAAAKSKTANKVMLEVIEDAVMLAAVNEERVITITTEKISEGLLYLLEETYGYQVSKSSTKVNTYQIRF